MNNFIFYPLIILIVVGSFNQLYNYGEISLSSDDTQNQPLIGNQSLDGEDQQLELDNASLDLNFNMTVGIVAVIVGAIALGLIGLNVLGSGLPDRSVKIIWNGIVFYGLWAIFSVLSITAISNIPLFGIFLWFILTFVYSLGVFDRMGN